MATQQTVAELQQQVNGQVVAVVLRSEAECGKASGRDHGSLLDACFQMREHCAMGIRLGRGYALAGTGLVLVMVLIACVLALANRPAFRDPELIGSFAQAIVPSLAISLIGGLIAIRLPRNRVGWILLSAAIINGATALLSQYLVHTLLVVKGSLPAVQWAAWLNSFLGGLIYPGMVVLIMLFFPDGKLPSRRWVWLVWADLGFSVVNAFVGIADPTPIQAPGFPPVGNPTGMSLFRGLQSGPIGYATFYSMMLLVLAGVASLGWRLWRARGDERQQVRWVVYALSLAVVLNVLLTLSSLFMPPSPEGRIIGNVASNVLVIAGFGVAFPVAIGVAILKYRLYDIDLVINRTLVFGALAAFITAVYVGIVVGLGNLIGSQGRPNLALSIVATAVVAVAFQPVRERVQRLVNRLVYGQRATPYEVMADFSEQMSETLAPDEVLPRMAEAAARGVAAESARVGVTFPDGTTREVWWPHPGLSSSLGHRVPVKHKDAQVGEIAVVKPPGSPVTSAEAKLLSDLAAQAGLVLHNIRLTAELQVRLDELTSQAEAIRISRQRLVTAGTSERNRLEQAISQGTEAELRGLAARIARAEQMLDEDAGKAAAMLDQLTNDVQQILDGLRRLAHGLYPPLLREKGLLPALQSQATREFTDVSLAATDLGRYSSEVEAAVYFCCLEAMRAAGQRAVVTLKQTGSAIEFVVSGAGLRLNGREQDMEDRIEAVGGNLEVQGNNVVGLVPALAVQ